MHQDDQARWDAKYSGRLGRTQSPPDVFVIGALEQLGPGQGRRALDLAAGTGRHALELARRGWETEAWDISAVGLGLLEQQASIEGVEITTRCLDVLGMRAARHPFDLVLCTDFLDRDLWRGLFHWVHPGGHVLVATFCENWPEAKPPERFRLRQGELEQGLPGLHSLRCMEARGRAGMLACRSF
jgi:tellurite methyltransferase